MALTLSVGFVVDDAIVMLENIVRHIEEGERPYQAAIRGAQEIGFTILSMTASLAAVFIPLVFMGGVLGRLLHEFAVTIILTIFISGIVSVTLTPMLCSRFLKPSKAGHHNRFYRLSENTFNRVQVAYERSLRWSLQHKPVIFIVFLLSLVATAGIFMISQEDFIPSEDSGQIIANTEASDRTSFTQMVALQKQVAAIAMKDPNIDGVMSSVGSGGGRTGSNTGTMFLKLKPRSERLSAEAIITELRPKLATVPGLNVYMNIPPAIRIGGHSSKSQYQYTLQDLNQDELEASATKLMNALKTQPGFEDVTTDMDLSAPAVNVRIDRDKAAAYGVTASQIETALGASFGGQQVSTIYGTSNQYWVMLELLPKYQFHASDLNRLYITAADGTTLVPLSAVTELVSGTMPLTINHLGQLPSITISFNLGQGVALGDAVSTIERVESSLNFPQTVQGSFEGQAQAFQSSMSNMGMLLIIAIITVYIVLGTLYESFIHPLTILSGLPSAAVGALITLYIFGIPLSLYAFVGMIMLVGIVKKMRS
jgi:HAE1 family hydrophobic/amphiphilic exporter-1